MDQITIPKDEIAHLARFGAGGDVRQFTASMRRLARRLKRDGSGFGDELLGIVAESSASAAALRRAPSDPNPYSLPQTDLLIEGYGKQGAEPVLPADLKDRLDRLIIEQRERRRLERAGLTPIRTALFVGPPGVGKTMTAHWVARELERPLYILNLAATSSSLFGKTGANIREALDAAQVRPSVLLLDEFDAIAKGRSEEDIGEAKRIVTVLLQQIDRWPSHSVLLAATNHGELLDRAVWRRFDLRLDFPEASQATAFAAARDALDDTADPALAELIAKLMRGRPLSDVVEVVLNARKRALLFDDPLDGAVLRAIQDLGGGRTRKEALHLALALIESGQSQRRASELTGVSRDTLRKHLKGPDDGTD
ncbi:MAG: AAA family ATPase [Shimia sp.]